VNWQDGKDAGYNRPLAHHIKVPENGLGETRGTMIRIVSFVRRPRPDTEFDLASRGSFINLFRMAVLALLTVAATHAGARAAGQQSSPVKIVAFGDSLTAGYLLPPADAFPAQLATTLTAKGHIIEMINAGVSGDTTAAGLERFEWSIPEGTDAVILELGANDALRGIDPAIARRNLDAILAKLKARNIDVLLAGMSAPQNWGADYADDFNTIYTDLSAQYGTLLYPFFLEGVALKPDLNLSDGLHPTGKGVAVIVERILPSVESLIERVAARRTTAARN
jgi:acyl-CoA thioesterase I